MQLNPFRRNPGQNPPQSPPQPGQDPFAGMDPAQFQAAVEERARQMAIDAMARPLANTILQAVTRTPNPTGRNQAPSAELSYAEKKLNFINHIKTVSRNAARTLNDANIPPDITVRITGVFHGLNPDGTPRFQQYDRVITGWIVNGFADAPKSPTSNPQKDDTLKPSQRSNLLAAQGRSVVGTNGNKTPIAYKGAWIIGTDGNTYGIGGMREHYAENVAMSSSASDELSLCLEALNDSTTPPDRRAQATERQNSIADSYREALLEGTFNNYLRTVSQLNPQNNNKEFDQLNTFIETAAGNMVNRRLNNDMSGVPFTRS